MRITPLRRSADLINGGTPTSDLEYWGGEVPWATPVDLADVDGGTLRETQRTLTQRGLRAGSACVPADSLILSTRAPIGYVARTTARTAFNQGCRGIVPQPGNSAKYLQYVLWASKPDMQAAGSGATFQELSTDALAELPVPLATAEEQRRTADFLDDQVACLDAAAMSADDLDRLADERSHIPQEALFDELAAPVLRLGLVAQVQSGVTLNAAGTPEGARSYPYLRVANVQDGWLDLRDVKEVLLAPARAAKARLRPGDVLMTEGGDLDKLARGTVWHGEVESCVHQNHVFAVRPRLSALLPEFLALVTRSASARAHFRLTARRTTNLASTNSANIKDLRLPVPGLAQQKHLVARARAAAAATEAHREEARRVRALLQERKRALITACVTGEFDVATASSRAAGAALAGAG